jgi:hypothetical protein
VLNDASSFKECGHTFCDGCIHECLAANPTCPTCRKHVHTGSNPNYALRDIIDKLEVRCPEYEKDIIPPSKRLKTTGENNSKDGGDDYSGCDWRGTVSGLQRHVADVCLLATISCVEGGCTHTCRRRDMEAHRSSQKGMLGHMELKYENKLKALEMKYESKYQMMNDSIIELQREANLCFNKQCNLPDRKIKRGVMYCTRCGVANYCSRACQTSDWRNHQAYCDRHVRGRTASQNGSGARPLANGSVNPPLPNGGADFDDGIDWGSVDLNMRAGEDDSGSVVSSNHFYGSALNDAIIRVVRGPMGESTSTAALWAALYFVSCLVSLTMFFFLS